MPVNVAVIPVAGKGTRLLPLTKGIAKELLPLGRKPVLQHVVEEMQDAGVSDIVMITSDGKACIEDHFRHDQALLDLLHHDNKHQLADAVGFLSAATSISYVLQQQQDGLGHAVLCARDAVGDQPFVVALGDAMIGLNTEASLCKRMLRVFDDNNADAVIAFQHVPLTRVNRYGVAELKTGYVDGDEAFTLTDLVEKPSADNAPSQFAIAARYICQPTVFDHLEKTPPGVGGEIQLTDALRSVIRAGGLVLGVPLAEHEKRYDVGNFDSYYVAFIEAALADPHCGGAVRERLLQLTADSVN